MNYLYISLFYFYTKVLKVQKDYAPIISITAVLSILVVFIIMILIELFKFHSIYIHGSFIKIVLGLIYLLVWLLLYRFYLPKEEAMLNHFKTKSVALKTTTFFLNTILIASIIIVWYNRYDIFR